MQAIPPPWPSNPPRPDADFNRHMIGVAIPFLVAQIVCLCDKFFCRCGLPTGGPRMVSSPATRLISEANLCSISGCPRQSTLERGVFFWHFGYGICPAILRDPSRRGPLVNNFGWTDDTHQQLQFITTLSRRKSYSRPVQKNSRIISSSRRRMSCSDNSHCR